MLSSDTARLVFLENQMIFRFVDIVATGCDAGIRYGEHLAQDMIAVPVGPRIQRAAMAASPAYSKARGAPVDPAELWSSFEGPWLYYSSRLTLSPLRAFVGILRKHQRPIERAETDVL